MAQSHICYLNGEFLPLSEAKVSVLDRGFVFGDGVYEVIPVFNKKLFRLDEHLVRLNNSLAAVRIKNPLDPQQWNNLLNKLITQQETGDLSVYVQVTRGVAPRDHAFPANTTPTVFMMANPMQNVAADIINNGVRIITLDDIRWKFCNIKAIALLPNILLRQQAVDNNATEAVLIRHGVVTEGSASNVFIVQDNIIKTPAKTDNLLPGITRDLVVELAHDHNLVCDETTVLVKDLETADEIWLTSSTKDIVPVTTVDEKPVGDGKPGPIYKTMLKHFLDYKDKLRK